MSGTLDNIGLTLPYKADYVSVARLAVSGISNRLGFDIDTIEDIKVAISEVCSKLVGMGGHLASSYTIRFEISVGKLGVRFYSEESSIRCIFENEDEELGVSLINALMDEVELCTNGDYVLYMSKTLEG